MSAKRDRQRQQHNHNTREESARMRQADAFYVDVYRSNALGDCTNGGISSRHDVLLVLCTKTNAPSDVRVHVDLDNPPDNLAKIVASPFGGAHIEPYANAGTTANGAPYYGGYMFGGNYAATSDVPLARALRAFEHDDAIIFGALPIHDRIE